MPSGPPELHERWGGDAAAIEHLTERGFAFPPGGIIVPPRNHEESEDDASALTYLFLEWDYEPMNHEARIDAFWMDRGL